MKSKLMLFIFLLFIGSSSAQTKIIEGKIVDATTHKPLIYANVYSEHNKGSISNEDGLFSFEVDSVAKVLHVSFVGYHKKTFPINEVPNVIELTTATEELPEIVVKPLDISGVISKFVKKRKEIHQRSKKIKPSNFFYRQTTYTEGECNEIIEVFLAGTPTISIDHLQLQTGRYASLEGDSTHLYATHTNFVTNIQLSPVYRKNPPKNVVIVPFQKNYNKYYIISTRMFLDAETELYEMSFTAKKDITRPIVEGSVIINPNDLTFKKYEGVIKNYSVLGNPKPQKCSLSFLVLYENKKGESIVKTVKTQSSYELNFPYKIFHIKINGLAYNMKEASVVNNNINRKKLKHKSILLKEISKQGYDSEFWKNNPVIKRTPLENKAILIFEKSNLFGTFKR